MIAEAMDSTLIEWNCSTFGILRVGMKIRWASYLLLTDASQEKKALLVSNYIFLLYIFIEFKMIECINYFLFRKPFLLSYFISSKTKF